MVEARNTTEDFDIGSTIWGTWVTDLNLLGSGYDPNINLLYRTVECNRSLTSSEGPFDVRYYISHINKNGVVATLYPWGTIPSWLLKLLLEVF